MVRIRVRARDIWLGLESDMDPEGPEPMFSSVISIVDGMRITCEDEAAARAGLRAGEEKERQIQVTFRGVAGD